MRYVNTPPNTRCYDFYYLIPTGCFMESESNYHHYHDTGTTESYAEIDEFRAEREASEYRGVNDRPALCHGTLRP